MAVRLAGKPVSDALQEELMKRIAACRERNVEPAMLLLRVGARDDDLAYERTILKRCEKLGIRVGDVERTGGVGIAVKERVIQRYGLVQRRMLVPRRRA